MISVVIPNYNSGHQLAKNLPKLLDLLKKSKLDFEIIVSDDGSTDDSIAAITKTHDREFLFRCKILTSEKNTGFGSCCDRGIKEAQGEIIFILNATDALPQSADYFSLMFKHFEDPLVFSVGAAKTDETGIHGCGEIYFEKGFYLHRKKTVDNRRSKVGLEDGKLKIEKINPQFSNFKKLSSTNDHLLSSQYTDWADGGSQAIRKSYYEKIGGFDPHYYLYWEDVDLGFRAWKAGYKIIYEPRAVLLHAKHEGPIAQRFTVSEIRNLNVRNQVYFTWKNSNLWHKLQFLFWLPYHVAVAVKNGNQGWIKALNSQNF